jgi:hypothetical protein
LGTAKRVDYLDLFRFLTVTLALVSHVVVRHSLYSENASEIGALLKSVTRAATPCLLILFGIMIELVYARKMKSAPLECSVGLIHRAILCYGALLAIALLTFVKGSTGIDHLLKAPVFLSPVENSDIFKLYTVLLILTIPLVFIRLSAGFGGILLVAASFWCLDWLVINQLAALPKPFDGVGSLLFGIGEEFGPTVPHSLLLLTFGMAIGNLLFRSQKSKGAMLTAALLTGISLYAIGAYLHSLGIIGVASKLAALKEWRNQNDFGYYAYGMLVSLIIVAVSYVLFLLLGHRLTRLPRLIGCNTLMYFFLGNALLLGVPRVPITSAVVAVIVVLVYIVVFSALTYAWVLYGKDHKFTVAINARIKYWIETCLGRVWSRPSVA